MSEEERYSRQNRVPNFGKQAQSRLSNSKVLIVGAGGLGGPVAAALAGAGVGHISVMDHDEISLSNLHRQWLFQQDQIGKPKALVLCDHLQRLNSEISVNAFVQRLSPDNVESLLEQHDLIVDAADNFATSYVISDACTVSNKLLLTASVNQLYGYVGLLGGTHGPSLRAIFPRIPLQQTSCDVVGVTGPAVGTVAGLQSQIALDTLAEANDWLGKMHYIDLRDFQLRSIDCSQAREPDGTRIAMITADQILESDWVVDVRDSAEVNLKPQSFTVDQQTPLIELDPSKVEPKGNRVVLACQSGQRALIAAQQLLDAGHDDLAVVVAGNAD